MPEDEETPPPLKNGLKGEKNGGVVDESQNNLEKNTKSSFFHNFLSAGVAASIAVTTMAPVERVKLILQIQNCIDRQFDKPYKNARDAFRRLVKEQGFYSLWRGNLASVIRCFPYQALNFAFKDKYNVLIVEKMSKSTITGRVLASIVAGGIGGCTATTIVYPLDFARTRMALNVATQGPDVETLRSTLKKTFQKDGLRGIYRGYPFSIVGVFIYRSTYFGLYDTAKLLTPSRHRNIYMTFLEAEAAATISGLTSYAFDTVRRAMMMYDGDPNFKTRDCIKNIYVKKGIRGFYQGAGINVLRGSGGAIMLVLYDKIQEFIEGTPPPYHHVTKSLTFDDNVVSASSSSAAPSSANFMKNDPKNYANHQKTETTSSNTDGNEERGLVTEKFCGSEKTRSCHDRYSHGLCDF